MNVVILAAGMGKRISSETDAKNKCLLKVENNSILMYALKSIIKSVEVSRFTIVVGHGAEYIEEEIGDSLDNVPINYVKQKKLDGILSALNDVYDAMVQEEDILVQLGDEYYYQPHYALALQEFRKNDCVFGVYKGTEEMVRKNYSIQYSKDNRPVKFCEKPEMPYNLDVGTGMFMLKKEYLHFIRELYMEQNKHELVDLLNRIIEVSDKVKSVRIADFYVNVNEIDDYHSIQKYLQEKDLSKYFFGTLKDIYDLHREDVKIIEFYHSKFAEVYEQLCGSGLTSEQESFMKTTDELQISSEEVEFYRSYLAMSHGNKVMELACGSGRITVPLAMKKVHVTGVDLSDDMLGILSDKLNGRYRKCRKYVTLLHDDITNLKKVDEKFNLVIFPATTIRLLDIKLDEFIDSIYDYLEDGGYFIFDFIEPKNESKESIIENYYNISYKQNGVRSTVFFQEQHNFEKRKTRVNFYVNSFGDTIEHYLSYTYLNIITKQILIDEIKNTRFSEVSFHPFTENDESISSFCVLKK